MHSVVRLPVIPPRVDKASDVVRGHPRAVHFLVYPGKVVDTGRRTGGKIFDELCPESLPRDTVQYHRNLVSQ